MLLFLQPYGEIQECGWIDPQSIETTDASLVLSTDPNFSRIFCGITHTYISTCRNSNLYVEKSQPLVKNVKFLWHYFLFTCENIHLTCEIVFFFLTFLQDESRNSNNNAAQHLCQSLQFLFFGLFSGKISNTENTVNLTK